VLPLTLLTPRTPLAKMPSGTTTRVGTNFAYNLRFPGQVFDGQAGLHYNYFRDFDPAVGRYHQSDPIGLRGGVGTYTYVNGNPIHYRDPNDLLAIPIPVPLPGIPAPPPVAVAAAAGVGIGMISTMPMRPLAVSRLGLRYMIGPTLPLTTRWSPRDCHPDIGPIQQVPQSGGRRNGVGVRDARNRFHRGVKQHCPGSNPTDAFGVNPDTGDVVDPAGEYVDNLGNANSE
jgi:RHS repeat-associated protein